MILMNVERVGVTSSENIYYRDFGNISVNWLSGLSGISDALG